MIKRVDFLGAPGVGKSTLCNELLKSKTKEANWMNPSVATIKLTQIELWEKSSKTISDYIILLFLHVCLMEKLQYLLSRVLVDKYSNVSILDNQEEEVALDYLIKSIASSPFPSEVRLLRYSWLLETLKCVSFLQKPDYINTNFTILYDESLTQKMISLGPWDSSCEKQTLGTLCHLLGSLSAVIFLDAEDTVVLNRLKQRTGKCVIHAHRRMGEAELISETKLRLKSARQLADILELSGVEIIRVNAEEPISDQVTLVKRALLGDGVTK